MEEKLLLLLSKEKYKVKIRNAEDINKIIELPIK